MGDSKQKSGARPWLVLIGCCILCGIGFGVPMTVMSSFMKPMIVSLAASATSVTFYFTIVMLVSMVSVVVGPRLVERNAPVAIVASGVVAGCGLIGIALGQSVAAIWVAAVFIGLSYPLCSTITTPIVIANWFKRGTGTFTGIALAFTGVAPAVLVPIAAQLMASVGWQRALLVFGAVYIVATVFSGAFLVRFAPRAG